jgi:hypothetical protein
MQGVAAAPKVNWCQVVPTRSTEMRTTELYLAGSESHAPHVRAAIDAAFSF